MVRHSWRGAFWSRLAGVGARRREAPHAQPAHCPAAPAVAQSGGTLVQLGRNGSIRLDAPDFSRLVVQRLGPTTTSPVEATVSL